MANKRIKNLDEDAKLYEIKRKNVLPYVGYVSVYILNHVNDKLIADEIDRNIRDSVEIKRDISEFESYYDAKINVFSEVRYMVVLVSRDFLKDWALMGILLDNYDLKGDDSNIIPLIVEDILYDPMEKTKIINFLKDYCVHYVEEYYVKDYDEDIPEELEKLQRIIALVKKFLSFSLKRDKKSDKPFYQKIIKYIESDMGINLMDEKKRVAEEEKNRMEEYGGMTNNFYAPVNGIQIQQGNKTAIQTQSHEQSTIDFENVQKVVEEIKKNDKNLDDIFGENASKVREILSEVTVLAKQQKEPKKVKDALLVLKDLSIGVTGSLIASGIVSMISGLNL